MKPKRSSLFTSPYFLVGLLALCVYWQMARDHWFMLSAVYYVSSSLAALILAITDTPEMHP